MSLLPKALQFRDEALSLPLGAAKVKPVEAKPDPNAWFDAEARKHPDDKPPKKQSLRDLEQAVFEDWLARTCPSGDVEQVQRLWEESTEYEEFCAEHNPAPPSTEKPPKFKVGDRVQYTKAILTREQFPPTQAQRTVGCVVDYRVHYVEGGWDHVESLELVSPSEPKEADGWIQMGPDMPALKRGQYHLRNKATGAVFRNGDYACLSGLRFETWIKHYEYRVVKQQ